MPLAVFFFEFCLLADLAVEFGIKRSLDVKILPLDQLRLSDNRLVLRLCL